MWITRRRELASRLLDHYVHGPAAATEATAQVLVYRRPRAFVLVEGVSDQIAVEALASRHGRDLAGAAQPAGPGRVQSTGPGSSAGPIRSYRERSP
jgi:hypothetical protein